MAEASGKIVARPMVARGCGCQQEFLHYAVDKYRAQRLEKFQRTRCPACVAKADEEQRRAADLLPKKGEAIQSLPPGTHMTITREADGGWTGTLSANGVKVTASGGGPQGVSVALARAWLAASGLSPKG